jgi:hypothetical protein
MEGRQIADSDLEYTVAVGGHCEMSIGQFEEFAKAHINRDSLKRYDPMLMRVDQAHEN